MKEKLMVKVARTRTKQRNLDYSWPPCIRPSQPLSGIQHSIIWFSSCFHNAENMRQQNLSLTFTSVLHKAAQNFLSCWGAHIISYKRKYGLLQPVVRFSLQVTNS
jgi:hypothetical protein